MVFCMITMLLEVYTIKVVCGITSCGHYRYYGCGIPPLGVVRELEIYSLFD